MTAVYVLLMILGLGLSGVLGRQLGIVLTWEATWAESFIRSVRLLLLWLAGIGIGVSAVLLYQASQS